jgi:hypothetical protein
MDDSDVDRFAKNEQIKAYAYCLYINSQMVDVEARSWRYDTVLKMLDLCSADLQKKCAVAASKCNFRKTLTSTTSDLVWFTILCGKVLDPAVCILLN